MPICPKCKIDQAKKNLDRHIAGCFALYLSRCDACSISFYRADKSKEHEKRHTITQLMSKLEQAQKVNEILMHNSCSDDADSLEAIQGSVNDQAGYTEQLSEDLFELRQKNQELKLAMKYAIKNIQHIHSSEHSQVFTAQTKDKTIVIKSYLKESTFANEKMVYSAIDQQNNKYLRGREEEFKVKSFGFSLVYRYYQGTLAEFTKKSSAETNKLHQLFKAWHTNALTLISSLVMCVDELHSNKIVHSNLVAENFFYNLAEGDFEIVLGGFSGATCNNSPACPGYAIDVYTLGVSIIGLLFGAGLAIPVGAITEHWLSQKFYDQPYSKEAIKLLMQMLAIDPRRRSSIMSLREQLQILPTYRYRLVTAMN